jgi:4-hydroxy-tetrahydrodipicolinate synthase
MIRKLEGVFPALITPFSPKNEIDEEGLRRNIEFVTKGGVSGIVPCGSTGESATLSHAEHKRMIEISVDTSTIPVIAGTGSNNTKEAIELTKYAEDGGADAALLITPYYNKPNRSGLILHFKEITNAVEIPIILYNIPSRTGINMDPKLIAELAEVDGIIGVKESSGNLSQVSKIIELTKDLDFFVLSGDDILTLPILSLGGSGVVSVAANIVPERISSLVRAIKQNELEKARKIHYEISPLFEALFLETNPIPVKKAAELMGLASGHLRLPLSGMREENEERLVHVLRSMGAI